MGTVLIVLLVIAVLCTALVVMVRSQMNAANAFMQDEQNYYTAESAALIERETLIANKTKPSPVPTTKTVNPFVDEKEAKIEYKWDTADTNKLIITATAGARKVETSVKYSIGDAKLSQEFGEDPQRLWGFVKTPDTQWDSETNSIKPKSSYDIYIYNFSVPAEYVLCDSYDIVITFTNEGASPETILFVIQAPGAKQEKYVSIDSGETKTETITIPINAGSGFSVDVHVTGYSINEAPWNVIPSGNIRFYEIAYYETSDTEHSKIINPMGGGGPPSPGPLQGR